MASFDGGEQLSGLAGEIRRSLDSEQYDLANYTEQRVKDLMVAAFSAPLTGPKEMIRCTFIAGGGKLVRQKYNDDLPKWILSALRDIGFTEDRSAAETFDSQGTFKQQHDTGQNLKYVIVYPRVAAAAAAAALAAGAGGGGGKAGVSPSAGLPDTKTPEYMAASAGLETFKQMVASKCESWRQRKRLAKVLQEASDVFQAIEQKLCSGAALDPREQALYESNSGQDAEKIAWLQGEIKSMSEGGRLSAAEKEELLASMQANLAAVEAERAKATEEGKVKVVEKLAEKAAAIVQRKGKIAEAPPHQARLRHGDEVQKLRMRLLVLTALEERPKSQGALTIADLQTLSEKPEIEAAVTELEKASRGWFEADDDFAVKCAFEAKEAAAKYKARLKTLAQKKGALGSSKGVGGKSGGGTQKIVGGSSSSSSSAAWSSIGVKKPVSQVPRASGGAGKPSGGFAAAFGNESEDDEDD